MKRAVYLLVLVLLSKSVASAQTHYNRWNAQPAPTAAAAASAQERGEKVLLAKARQDSLNTIKQLNQDSLRLIALAPLQTHLQRGVKQRIDRGEGLPTDVTGYEYIRRSIAYPISALRARTEGTVRVRLWVDAEGQVTQTKVIESTIPPDAEGRDIMLQQARLIMRGLRFEAATGATEEELGVNFRIL